MKYFTSDQHFGHKNIIKYSKRPFSDIEEMHDTLIKNFNNAVSQNDETYHLGDFSLDDRIVKFILPKLNGTHYLIAGNHDACFIKHKGHKKQIENYISYGFSKVFPHFTTLNLDKETILLSHLPPADQNFENIRYFDYRPKNDGQYKYIFHGHVHEAWKIKDNCINVGVDQWNYTPVSFDVLIHTLESK